jgi:hypothetical protein
VAMKMPWRSGHMDGREMTIVKCLDLHIEMLHRHPSRHTLIWSSEHTGLLQPGVVMACMSKLSNEVADAWGCINGGLLPTDGARLSFLALGGWLTVWLMIIIMWIIADDAFTLRTWLLKTYSARGLTREQRIFINTPSFLLTCCI